MASYPIKLTEYLHGDKFHETDTPSELRDEGYDEATLDNVRYLIYELELSVELHENGDVYITHIKGQKLTTPIKNT